mgnify:CR=1 FL=1
MNRPASTFLTALAVLFAGQLIRVLFPSIGWYLRDTVFVSVTGLIPYAIGPFLLGFLALLIVRLPARSAVLAAGAGLAGGGRAVAGAPASTSGRSRSLLLRPTGGEAGLALGLLDLVGLLARDQSFIGSML